jgi:hypothetical protein
VFGLADCSGALKAVREANGDVFHCDWREVARLGMTTQIDQMDQRSLLLVRQADFYERVGVGDQLPHRNESIYDIAEEPGVSWKTVPIVERTEFPGESM